MSKGGDMHVAEGRVVEAHRLQAWIRLPCPQTGVISANLIPSLLCLMGPSFLKEPQRAFIPRLFGSWDKFWSLYIMCEKVLYSLAWSLQPSLKPDSCSFLSGLTCWNVTSSQSVPWYPFQRKVSPASLTSSTCSILSWPSSQLLIKHLLPYLKDV